MKNCVHSMVEREKAKAKAKKKRGGKGKTKTKTHSKNYVVPKDHTAVQTLTLTEEKLECKSRRFLFSTGDLQTSFRD